MIPITTYKGKRVAVFGLGGSGLTTAEALIDGGAEVIAWDDSEPAREAAKARDIPVLDWRGSEFAAYSALVAKARANGVALLAIRNSHHFAALWPDVEPLAGDGLVALDKVLLPTSCTQVLCMPCALAVATTSLSVRMPVVSLEKALAS